jgi:hypothetical protein
MAEWPTFQVPSAIEPEVAVLVECLKLAATRGEAPFGTDDVVLIKPAVREFDGGAVAQTILFAGSAQVFGWITKAWFDAYVLPVLLERVRQPSEQFQDWLRKALASNIHRET